MGRGEIKSYANPDSRFFEREETGHAYLRLRSAEAMEQYLVGMRRTITVPVQEHPIDYFEDVRELERLFEVWNLTPVLRSVESAGVYAPSSPTETPRQLVNYYPKRVLCVDMSHLFAEVLRTTMIYSALPTALHYYVNCLLSAISNRVPNLSFYMAWGADHIEYATRLREFAQQLWALLGDSLLLSHRDGGTVYLALAMEQDEFMDRMLALPHISYYCCEYDALVYNGGDSYTFLDTEEWALSFQCPHLNNISDGQELIRVVRADIRRHKLSLLL